MTPAYVVVVVFFFHKLITLIRAVDPQIPRCLRAAAAAATAAAASLSLLCQMPHALQMFTEHVHQPPHGDRAGTRIDGRWEKERLPSPSCARLISSSAATSMSA